MRPSVEGPYREKPGVDPPGSKTKMVIKAIWTLSAIIAIGVGLLLPIPALLGAKSHNIDHMVVAQN